MHEELNAFNRIAVEEMYAIIITIVDCIGQTTVVQFARLPRVDTHCIGYLVQRLEHNVG